MHAVCDQHTDCNVDLQLRDFISLTTIRSAWGACKARHMQAGSSVRATFLPASALTFNMHSLPNSGSPDKPERESNHLCAMAEVGGTHLYILMLPMDHLHWGDPSHGSCNGSVGGPNSDHQLIALAQQAHVNERGLRGAWIIYTNHLHAGAEPCGMALKPAALCRVAAGTAQFIHSCLTWRIEAI